VLTFDTAVSDFLNVKPLSLRDPSVAVAYAEQEVLLTKRKKPGALLSVAQAYRSAGQIEKAHAAASEGLALLSAVNAEGTMTRTRKLLQVEAAAKGTSK
jgi:hypothetical protein